MTLIIMKNHFLSLVLSCIFITGMSQEKIAVIDPGSNFSQADHSVGYYDQYQHHFHINLQNGSGFTRLAYDSNFKLTDSFSFTTKAITFNYNHLKRSYFLTGISIESGSYEAYADEEKIIFLQPDFKEKTDKKVYEHTIKQTEKDERILAIFPGKTAIRILSASFEKDKLFLYSWTPGIPVATTSFDLPESNITDDKQKKEIPKIARVKFSRDLTSLSVQPLKQTILFSRPGASLYYADDRVYILCPSPYNLGEYLIELNLVTSQYKGTNYFVNNLQDNASTKISWHKTATAALYDTLLVIKNASDRIYEYYFYDIRTGSQLKKYSSSPDDLQSLIHSDMKQKGSWISTNQEKDLDNYKRFLRKGSAAMVYVSSISPDSLTITNLALLGTTGIAGTLLDVFVPLPLGLTGFPEYATVMIPPLGKKRDKIIYAHSKFSLGDLSPSKSSTVSTGLDKLLDDNNSNDISSNSSFLIKKNETYYLGYYSTASKKIEVYKYYGDH